MGCSVSKEVVQIKPRRKSNATLPTVKTKDIDAEMTQEKKCSDAQPSEPVRPNIQTTYKSFPVRLPLEKKPVNLNSNGVARNEQPPVAMATIILRPSNNSANQQTSTTLPNQTVETKSSSPPTTVRISRPDGTEHTIQRRMSDNNSLKPKCIAKPIQKDFSPNSNEVDQQKSKHSPFGPRNSRLVLTQSQVDFFRMLDEKIAQGKDYCSEDEQSLVSMQSWNNPRKDSSSSAGLSLKTLQEVR